MGGKADEQIRRLRIFEFGLQKAVRHFGESGFTLAPQLTEDPPEDDVPSIVSPLFDLDLEEYDKKQLDKQRKVVAEKVDKINEAIANTAAVTGVEPGFYIFHGVKSGFRRIRRSHRGRQRQ